ncbi:MAG: hypothetical protein WBB23_21745 [Desulforhopalus sp.]
MKRTRWPYRKNSLGKIIKNILAKQDIPNGCIIRIERDGRQIRSDKVYKWALFARLDDKETVFALISKIKIKIKALEEDGDVKIQLLDPDGLPISANTHLGTIREMEAVPTIEEESVRKIYESVRAEIKDKQVKYDMDDILDTYIGALIDRYTINEVEKALYRAKENYDF